MDLLLRLLLLRGPASHRLFLVALYAVCLTSLLFFMVAFSIPPPESYPEFNDQMDRAMMPPALVGLPIMAIALLTWVLGTAVFLAGRSQRTGPYGWLLAVCPTS